MVLTPTLPPRPEVSENFGTWMLVKKPQRKKMNKQGDSMAAPSVGESGSGLTRNVSETRRHSDPRSEKGNNRNQGIPQSTLPQSSGSRFGILGDMLNDNLGHSHPDRRSINGKPRDEDQFMETATPVWTVLRLRKTARLPWPKILLRSEHKSLPSQGNKMPQTLLRVTSIAHL